MQRQEKTGNKGAKGRAQRSPYARVPYDARLLIRFLELLAKDDVKYASGGRYTSRIHKAVVYAMEEGSEELIVFSGFPGIWYVRSGSRPALNRWYVFAPYRYNRTLVDGLKL